MSKLLNSVKSSLYEKISEICNRPNGLSEKGSKNSDGTPKPQVPIFTKTDRINNIMLIVYTDLFKGQSKEEVQPKIRRFAEDVVTLFEKKGSEAEEEVKAKIGGLVEDQPEEPEVNSPEEEIDEPEDDSSKPKTKTGKNKNK